MEDLEEVRRRIARKHHSNKNNKILGDRQFSHLYRFAMTTMCLCVLCLGAASYVKQNPEAMTMIKENMNFSWATQWISTNVLSVIPFVSHESGQDMVNAPASYEALGEGLYRVDNHLVSSLQAGIVISVSDNGVVISLDNGITATYENLSEVEVALYDHVAKGETIGRAENQFTMQLIKDGQEIGYEEALSAD